MPYQITNQTYFVIDGSETNAGERIFLRDAVFIVIDGAEAGTSGQRQFMRDHRLFVIDGGPRSGKTHPVVTYSMAYAITGRATAAGIYATPSYYVIDGIVPPNGPATIRATSFFAIEME